MNYFSYGSKFSLQADFLAEKCGENMFNMLFAFSMMLNFA